MTYVSFRYDGEKGCGYATSKLFTAGSEVQLDIVDFVADPAAAEALLAQIHAFAREQRASQVNIWLNRNHPSFFLLERSGYAHTTPINWLGYRPLQPNDQLDHLRNYDNWYVTMGDSDVY